MRTLKIKENLAEDPAAGGQRKNLASGVINKERRIKEMQIQLKDGLFGNDAGIYYNLASEKIFRIVWNSGYPMHIFPGQSWRHFSLSVDEAQKALEDAQRKASEAKDNADLIELPGDDRMLCTTIKNTSFFHLPGLGFGKEFHIVVAEWKSELKLMCSANRLERYDQKVAKLAKALTAEDEKLLGEVQRLKPGFNLSFVTPKPWKPSTGGFLSSPHCSRISFAKFQEMAMEILGAERAGEN